MIMMMLYSLEWGTNNGHVTGPTCHYDVIDFVFRRVILCLLLSGAVAPLGNKHKTYDVIMTSLSYHVAITCSPF